MAKGDTLKLLATVYDQAQDDGTPPTTRRINQGETFKARTEEEYDRLVASGAALDPKEALAKAKADAEAEAQTLRDQAAELEAQATEAAKVEDDGDLSSLTKPELVERAKAAGLEGYSDLTKAELLDALSDAE